MRHARLFSIIVSVIALAYGAVGFYFLPGATFQSQSELTRMALLPESLFGWTKPQPALDIQWMRQASMKEADVLVIGDSFSHTRVWQTRLTREGLRVRTEPWGSMRGICEDFMPWLRAQGFAGRFVVLEVIERNLQDLRRSVACRKMQYHPSLGTDAPSYPPAVSFDAHLGNYSGKLSTGLRLQMNVLEYERRRRDPGFDVWQLSGGVKMARVKNGCELFSHARCAESLFFAVDKPEDVDASLLEDIATLNGRVSGITPIWAFVPNKSTAYLYPDKPFWNEAERRFDAPNLLRMTQQAIDRRVIDLYPANNTHFSTEGYLLMGDEILQAIRRVQRP